MHLISPISNDHYCITVSYSVVLYYPIGLTGRGLGDADMVGRMSRVWELSQNREFKKIIFQNTNMLE